ncbi:MAG TPA: hypothetical protein VKJ00_15500 [Thermoanaerobaculia bacterium]|nr:hypothetical protein [Thermoanaerobaculia bacterium]
MAKETPFDRARDFVSEKIDQTKEALGDFDDVGEDLRKNFKKTAKRLEKDYGYLWDDARRYIRENPGAAVAIALGAGFLLGLLLRGGDD